MITHPHRSRLARLLAGSRLQLGLVVLTGLALRLILAALAPHPGIADPNHYYNLARNLADGRGFVIDYIWQYHNPPPTVTHPIDYWMPLPGVWAALGLRVGGGSLFAALLPSVIIGMLIALLTYRIAKTAGLTHAEGLMGAGFIAFLPELILNSVRVDTTISYVLFVSAALLCFHTGWQTGRSRSLLISGLLIGLAHLTRQDAIILGPALGLSSLVYWRAGGKAPPWRGLLLLLTGWLLVLAPWLWRNYQLYGVLMPSGAGRTLFMTSFIDQFTYGRTLDLAHYLNWGWRNILGNIAFQTLANVKTVYTVLDFALPVTTLAGFGALLLRRDRERLLLVAAPLIFMLGLFVFYSFLTPFHTMGGSFKKSYMSILPYLAVISACGLKHFVTPRPAAYAAGAVIAGFMLLNGVELTRADFGQARRYASSIEALAGVLNAQPDLNEDGRITVMTQDPYILNYYGFPALMLPSDDRDMILEACARYGVDYIILPADRPALDPLYDQVERDPRLPLVAVSDPYQLLAVAGLPAG